MPGPRTDLGLGLATQSRFRGSVTGISPGLGLGETSLDFNSALELERNVSRNLLNPSY